MLAHITVNALDDIPRQGHIDLLGLAQIRRNVELQHSPAHPGVLLVAVVCGNRGWHRNRPAFGGYLLQHDVSDFDTFARLHIIPHLGPFLDQHPGLNIDVILNDHSVNLVEEGIDVALRMGTLSDSSLTARKIGQSACLILGTPTYFERFGEPQTPVDILKHQAVIYSLGGGARWDFTQGKDEQPVIAKGRVRVTAAEGVRAAVLAHQGLAMASQWMFSPELASGEVKAVLTDWELPPRDLWAVFPTGRMASAKARAFVEYVQGLLA